MHILAIDKTLFQPKNKKSIKYSKNFEKNYSVNNSKICCQNTVTPSFKKAKTDNVNIKLLLNDDNIQLISFETIVKEPFEYKQGILPIYEIASHQKAKKLKQHFPNMQQNNFFYDGAIKKTEFFGTSNNVTQILPSANNYIKINFTQEELDNAKKLAIVAYTIQLEDPYNKGLDFDDTPQNLSIHQYKDFLNMISLDDLNKYNKDRQAHSDINIVLTLNKTFFNENKNYIQNSLDNIKNTNN